MLNELVSRTFSKTCFDGRKPEPVKKIFVDPCDGVEKFCCTSTDELYRLKNWGLLKELPGGGSVIEANTKTKFFKLPYTLKNLPQKSWSREDKIWFNM